MKLVELFGCMMQTYSYCTGLLLLSRFGLFLTFAINANGSESINLVAVSSISLALLAIQRRVYEQRWKDSSNPSLFYTWEFSQWQRFISKKNQKIPVSFLFRVSPLELLSLP